jgi:DNA transposition AAA+ family ATPase
MATISASTADMTGVQQEVLAAMGMPDAKGTARKLSYQIKDRVRDLTKPLIILDEAQHMTSKAIEEARSWHDATGVGVALFGNIGVLNRIDGTGRDSAFAQLASRVAMRLVRQQPLTADADALAMAWQVYGDPEVMQIRKVAMLPGGLRNATMMLELGTMIASAEGKVLALDHLQDAWSQLSSKAIAA